MIRAVFVDVDGTVVDSEPRNRRAIEAVALIGGHRIMPEDWNTLAGQGDSIIWGHLSDINPSLKDVFHTAASFEQACTNAKLINIKDVRAIPETLAVLALFRENKLDIAPVSNSITPDAMASLKHSGYEEADFAFCLFRDELQRIGLRAKPHPDPYQEALRRMDAFMAARDGDAHKPLKPHECLILEDSKTGGRSGLHAGMHTVQMTNETPALDDDEVLEMTSKHKGVYKALERHELYVYCQTLLAPKP